jgi:hypothetical protein
MGLSVQVDVLRFPQSLKYRLLAPLGWSFKRFASLSDNHAFGSDISKGAGDVPSSL